MSSQKMHQSALWWLRLSPVMVTPQLVQVASLPVVSPLGLPAMGRFPGHLQVEEWWLLALPLQLPFVLPQVALWQLLAY